MAEPLQTVVETEPFLRKAKELGLSEDERRAIVDAVARDPGGGDEVIAGHVRKRRIAGRSQGKRGGYRIAVAYFGPDLPAYILAILSKGETGTFSADQRKRIAEASEAVAASKPMRGR